MWQLKSLQLTDNITPINCAVIDVSPWTYGAGRIEESGHYLSPENAVDYLAKKLIQSDHAGDVVIFMLAASQRDLFIQSLSVVNEIFPMATFKQTARYINADIDKALNRLQTPASFIPPLTMTSLAVPTLQKILTCQASSRSANNNNSIDDLIKDLNVFQASQAAQQAAKLNEIAKLKSLTAPIFVFTSTGAADQVSLQMKRNIPVADSIYTVAVMFLAPELSTLRGLINDSTIDTKR